MLEFKRNPHAHGRKRPARHIDGFIRTGSNETPALDDFRARQSVIGSFNQSGSENFVKPESTTLGNVDFAKQTTAQAATGSLATMQLSDEPRNLSQKGRRSGKRRFRLPSLKKTLKRTSLVLCSLLLLVGGFFAIKFWIIQKNIFRGGGGALALNKDIDPNLLNGEGDGRINVMLLGKGGKNHPGGELTDTILVASIDPIGKEGAILSIPRDLWVKSPDFSAMKINAVYSTAKNDALADKKSESDAEAAGIDQLERTIENSVGISIHYYVTVDFDAFKRAVDVVGGIDITLEQAIFDPNFDHEYGKNALKLPAGNVHLNGTQALLLGRARGAAGGYGVSSDFDRNENQRKMLIALKDKILSAGTFGNPAKINELLNAFSQNVRTNFNGASELMRLYDIIKEVPSSSIRSLSFVDPPNVLVSTANIGGQSVVVPRAGQSNFEEIKKFVRLQLVDGFIKNEAATITVLNGTTSKGAGTKRADELKSYGYNVTTVENAPTTNYSQTILIDRTKGLKKYTKRYLEQRLAVSAQSSDPDPALAAYTTDFVIIVGNNETTSR